MPFRMNYVDLNGRRRDIDRRRHLNYCWQLLSVDLSLESHDPGNAEVRRQGDLGRHAGDLYPGGPILELINAGPRTGRSVATGSPDVSVRPCKIGRVRTHRDT